MADAAVDLCTSLGAYIPQTHMISRLARIATSGQHPSNAERDLHHILEKLSLQIQPTEVDVRMWDHKNSRVVWTKVPVIMPDSMASAIWTMGGKDMFHWFFCGDMSHEQIEEYWNHVHSTSEWFQVHPAATYPRRGLLPLSLYGDEVATYKNSEVGSIMVLAWTSDFCYNRPPLLRYCLLTTYAEYLESDFTYNDIMSAVCDRIIKMTDIREQFVWSADYTFMFSSNQGDLKYMLHKHKLFSYMSNDMCSWCRCCKVHAQVSMTLGDMREDAAHSSTLISHQEFMQSTTPDESSLHVNNMYRGVFN